MKIRTAKVTHVFPANGRRRAYATVLDEENSLHYFYGPVFDLKAGDKVKIEYTSSPSQGGWAIQ